LYTSSNGYTLNEQDIFRCVKRFYDMHVFVLSNMDNTNHCILILDEVFNVYDNIIIPKVNNQLTLYTAHWIDNVMIWKDTLTGFSYYDVKNKTEFYKTQHNFGGWLTQNIFIETSRIDANTLALSIITLIK
jgi:hypothetical protein